MHTPTTDAGAGAVPAVAKSAQPQFRVSFDVGGTFTDFTLLEEHTGVLHFFKVPSTPHDPAVAIGSGLAHLLQAFGIAPSQMANVGHGTTVATNMVIERRGARTALLTTRGFRDVLEIGRQVRPHLYDYNVVKPVPLVPRELRFEIDERMLATGDILRELDTAAVERAALAMREAGVRAVAICFLHSYRADAHERQAAQIVRRILPDAYVSVSSEILPEFREYERMSTTALNAYVGPRMSAYMGNLSDSVHAMGITAETSTVHSNGGLMSVRAVRSAPVRTCVSGPAAGVVGAAELGRTAGFPNLVTFDVGGTSTDVSLVHDGRPLFTSGRQVADYPVKTQMIDVHVIGAGGGSLGRIDAAGALKVGPQSAGAVPGPVAYGLGGRTVTLTDAHVVLGRLDPVALLDGRMKIDSQAAREAVREQIAVPLGLSLEEAAHGMLRIANANMARAVRAVSTERGYDIREFALCAFGGAGGLHASELASDCGLSTVLVPQEPGTMCARGILLSDISMDFVKTRMVVATEQSWTGIAASFEELSAEARQWLEREGIPAARQRFRRRIDARYHGQNFEIPVDVEDGPLLPLASFLAAFSLSHIREYGYDAKAPHVEIVNCRVQALGIVPRAPLSPIAGGASLRGAIAGERRAYFAQGGWQGAAIYRRSLLPVAQTFIGPAIVEEMSATTVVLPGQSARLDRFGNLVIDIAA